MAAPTETTWAFVEYLCLFLGVAGSLLLKVTQKQPEPYMDEIFHIPQAQKYCSGNFHEWDPMITTLPGLYLSSVGIHQPLSRLFGFSMKLACNTFWLRSINVIFSVGNVFVIKILLTMINRDNPRYDVGKGMATTMALSIFPVLYFFTFLYYTDPGSTFCVLLMYLMALQKHHITSAGIGVLAVLFRQTNVIWVVFTAGVIASQKVIDHIQPTKKDISRETQQSFTFLRIVVEHLLKDLRRMTAGTKQFWTDLVCTLVPYALVCVAFVVFVIINGSIVVGAKDDHQVSMNFPQLFYFAAFTGFFAVSHLLSPRKMFNFLKFIHRRPFLVIILAVVASLLIWNFTYEHKYLLADNRHYTFYIWQRIYRRHEYVKYVLIPGYLFAWWSIFDALKQQNYLWKVVYFVCVCVNLVPQMLLEFRYFIVPYLMFRLHSQVNGYVQIVFEILLYLAINAATLYLFIEKPFTWPSETSQQRFLW